MSAPTPKTASNKRKATPSGDKRSRPSQPSSDKWLDTSDGYFRGTVGDLKLALSKNPNITSVSMVGALSPYSLSRIEAILAGLKHKIDHLNLSDCAIGATSGGTQRVIDIINANPTIEDLDLSNNQLQYEGGDAPSMKNMIELLHGLNENKTIIDLNLSDNNIRGVCVELIAQLIKVNKTLDCLDLNRNKIDTAASESIITALRDNTTLCYLELKSNDIDRVTAKAIDGIVAKNRAQATI